MIAHRGGFIHKNKLKQCIIFLLLQRYVIWSKQFELFYLILRVSGWVGLTSFLPPWPLTPAGSPAPFLACSIRAFSCCTLLISVFASSSRYIQVFFSPSFAAEHASPTGATSSPATSVADGDDAAEATATLAWMGWGATARAGSAVSTGRKTQADWHLRESCTLTRPAFFKTGL